MIHGIRLLKRGIYPLVSSCSLLPVLQYIYLSLHFHCYLPQTMKYSFLKVISMQYISGLTTCKVILLTDLYVSSLFSLEELTLSALWQEEEQKNLTCENLEFNGLLFLSGQSYWFFRHDMASFSFPLFHVGNVPMPCLKNSAFINWSYNWLIDCGWVLSMNLQTGMTPFTLGVNRLVTEEVDMIILK